MGNIFAAILDMCSRHPRPGDTGYGVDAHLTIGRPLLRCIEHPPFDGMTPSTMLVRRLICGKALTAKSRYPSQLESRYVIRLSIMEILCSPFSGRLTMNCRQVLSPQCIEAEKFFARLL
jgi:hypothetical protein